MSWVEPTLDHIDQWGDLRLAEQISFTRSAFAPNSTVSVSYIGSVMPSLQWDGPYNAIHRMGMGIDLSCDRCSRMFRHRVGVRLPVSALPVKAIRTLADMP